MLSLCNWQYVAILLCGKPGPEKEGCCLCTYGNAIYGNVTLWQSWSWPRRTGMLSLCIGQYVARILFGNPGPEEERCPSFNTLPPPPKSLQPAKTSFVSTTEKSAAYINWKLYSDYHLWKQLCLYLDELAQVFLPTLGNLDHSQTWSTSETHYPAHRYITGLPAPHYTILTRVIHSTVENLGPPRPFIIQLREGWTGFPKHHNHPFKLYLSSKYVTKWLFCFHVEKSKLATT